MSSYGPIVEFNKKQSMGWRYHSANSAGAGMHPTNWPWRQKPVIPTTLGMLRQGNNEFKRSLAA